MVKIMKLLKKILSRLLSFKRRLCGIYLERMYSSLRKYKRDTKRKLSDGCTVGGQDKTKTLYIKLKMLCKPFIPTAFYVRMSHYHNSIISAQKVVFHGVDINVTR